MKKPIRVATRLNNIYEKIGSLDFFVEDKNNNKCRAQLTKGYLDFWKQLDKPSLKQYTQHREVLKIQDRYNIIT